MTTRLYYDDSHLREFDARVVAREDDGRRVYLDRTAFYPTSGGQPNDRGTLGDAHPVDVVDVIDEGERIAHVLAVPLPAGVESVRGAVDWERRLDHMQQHTAQHLLSALFVERFGLATVSVHFGASSSSLDLAADGVSRDRLVAVERAANGIVAEDRAVRVDYEEAAAATGLRRASAREGTLRIVTIAGIDRSACGGTHVRATGAIGAVLLRGVEKMRNSIRVEFVAGLRAVRRARADHEALAQIAAGLSASLDDAPAIVAARAEELRTSEQERRRLEREIAVHRARALWEAAPPRGDGLRIVVSRDARATSEEVRALAQATIALPRTLFVGAIASPASVVVATSEDSGVDAGRRLREVLAAHGGRGGGSPRLAQGSAGEGALDAVVDALAQ